MSQKLREFQGQLIQAEKMVSVGTLVSGVAHELNNPAGTIMLNAEFFSKAWKDIVPILDRVNTSKGDYEIAGLPFNESKEEINQLIPDLLNNAHRIKNIIEELKEFSRKEDSPVKQPMEINKVIQASINLTNNMIKKATKNFSWESEEILPEISGSFQRLEQVFINLIQNACQSLSDNTHGIYISTGYDNEKNEIIVKIKDEGEGIEEKDLKKITDPFFTTKRSNGGTGLGLSISFQIIKDHGGSINFESKKGKGTTVSVRLPITPLKEEKG
ncbi:MAG: GHKL domain-containing protein [Candidatus Aminicenantes bacterium]|nr:GHKL domain-containing protein [Candidatus Aminicenantes bacterium]